MKRLLLAGIAALAPFAAPAWDAGGHMLVGQIAWQQLTPAARQKSSALIQTLEKTYNEGQAYNFVTAGCWMDDMRAKPDYAWGKWHYVTIPWTPSGMPCKIPAEGPHIVWAIGENLKTLRDPAAAKEQRALALAMLIHFVGDLHQPLHATDRGDRGGNAFSIHGVPFTDLFPGTLANLHSYWDKAYGFDRGGTKVVATWQCPPLAQRPKAPGEGTVAEHAAKLMAAYPPEALWQLQEPLSAVVWTRESHLIGCLAGYPLGPQPGFHEIVEISPDFAAQAGRIAQQRVVLAGYRLGRLLNELFK